MPDNATVYSSPRPEAHNKKICRVQAEMNADGGVEVYFDGDAESLFNLLQFLTFRLFRECTQESEPEEIN